MALKQLSTRSSSKAHSAAWVCREAEARVGKRLQQRSAGSSHEVGRAEEEEGLTRAAKSLVVVGARSADVARE
jgi:hypothetical protein